MKNAILLHGKPGKEEYYNSEYPSASNSHWFPWLQKELMIRDIKTDTPEVPYAYDPQWDLWVKEVERFDMTPETTLVGHSCGGGFWLKYLSIHKELVVGKVVLVAPSHGFDWDSKDFFICELDRRLVDRTKGITVFQSSDDKPAIGKAIEHYSNEIDRMQIRKFEGYGHFTFGQMQSNAFPELLQEVISG